MSVFEHYKSIKDSGGWPEGMNFFIQDLDTDLRYFCKKFEIAEEYDSEGCPTKTRPLNEEEKKTCKVLLTKEDYEFINSQ